MAAAETSGDDSDWAREAYLYSDLVATVLISFRGQSPEADDDERPSTSALPAAMSSLEWGKRTKRSRSMRIPRILLLAREEEEEERSEMTEATAAGEAKLDNRKGKRRRASPKSPLEGYSSASASGGEEGRSTGGSIAAPEERCDEVMTVAATNQRAPTVSRLVRRPSSTKMTKVELQAKQMSLLEEKAKLLEEIGKWRKTLEEMRVDNGKLKEDTLQRSSNSWELFRSTHIRKDGTFVDTRSSNINDEMTVRFEQASQSSIEGEEPQIPSHADINEMYYDVGGAKKNSVYGLGSQAKVIYDRQLNTHRFRGRSSYSSVKFQALEAENEALRARVTTIEKHIEEIMSHFRLSQPLMSPSAFPTPQTPHDFSSQETQDPRALDE